MIRMLIVDFSDVTFYLFLHNQKKKEEEEKEKLTCEMDVFFCKGLASLELAQPFSP